MLKMRIKLVEHCLGNVLDMCTWLVMNTWIMVRPDDTNRWFSGPQRTLHPFKITEPLFQVEEMIMSALIVILPAMCFPLCLESQEKRINILLGKCLQALRMRILLHEKGEKVSQTIGAEMQRTCTDTSRQFALDVLLDD